MTQLPIATSRAGAEQAAREMTEASRNAMPGLQNGYQIIQVSALGRRSVGALIADKKSAQMKADELTALSTGEHYEIQWHIGMPRDEPKHERLTYGRAPGQG